MIPGRAGRLEALLDFDPGAKPRLAAVVCHPHPLYGGTMHNKVVFRASKTAREAGLATLRFNFRGVGKSQGRYDEGRGERDDVRAALDYLGIRFPGLASCVVGFSFGAWVGLAVGAEDARVAALVGIGLPVGSTDFSFLGGVAKPKLFIQGTKDQYGPRAQLEALFATLADPKQLHWVEGADHFLSGKLAEIQPVLRAFFQAIAG